MHVLEAVIQQLAQGGGVGFHIGFESRELGGSDRRFA
jgi:hypothetical protein